MEPPDPRPFGARLLYRATMVAAVVGVVATLVDLALGTTGSLADRIGDVLVLAIDIPLAALAWGIAANGEPGLLRRGAALLALVVVLLPWIVGMTGVGNDTLGKAFVLPRFLGMALVASMVAQDGRGRARVVFAVVAIAGAALRWSATIVPMPAVLLDVGALLGFAGLALTLEVARRSVEPRAAKGSIADWDRAGRGAMFIVAAERVRLGLIAVLFVLGFFLGERVNAPWVIVIATLGNVLSVIIAAFGALALQRAPGERAWPGALLGFALLGLVAGLCETLILTQAWFGLRLDVSGAVWFSLVRVVAQNGLAASALLTLGALGLRAGRDVYDSTRGGARNYAIVVLLAFLQAFISESVPSLVMVPVSLALVGFLVAAIIELVRVGDQMRRGVVAATAEDLFGDT